MRNLHDNKKLSINHKDRYVKYEVNLFRKSYNSRYSNVSVILKMFITFFFYGKQGLSFITTNRSNYYNPTLIVPYNN